MRAALETIAQTVSGGRATAQTLDWAALRYQHAAALRSRLNEQHNFRTVNKILSGLRSVARECWRLGLISADDLARIRDVPNITGKSLPAGRDLSVLEIARLMDACLDGTPIGARDAAMIAIFSGAGLRRSEVVELDVADYDATREVLHVGHSKGNKERMAPLVTGAAPYINAWLEVRPAVMGPLLLPPAVRGGDRCGRLWFRCNRDRWRWPVAESRCVRPSR